MLETRKKNVNRKSTCFPVYEVLFLSFVIIGLHAQLLVTVAPSPLEFEVQFYDDSDKTFWLLISSQLKDKKKCLFILFYYYFFLNKTWIVNWDLQLCALLLYFIFCSLFATLMNLFVIGFLSSEYKGLTICQYRFN